MRPKNNLLNWKVLESLERTGNLTQACIENDCDLSTASRQLAALEEDLGVSLLDRRRKPMQPTRFVKTNLSLIRRIEELGQKIKALQENGGKMDPAALAETVKAYNAACAAGEDKEFGRLKSTLQPVSDGPFYACPLVAGGPNTKGGLAANAKREVLDWNLQPIPGLYAVGEIASALKFVYQGGGNLTECLVFGQVCGKEVAKLPNRA